VWGGYLPLFPVRAGALHGSEGGGGGCVVESSALPLLAAYVPVGGSACVWRVRVHTACTCALCMYTYVSRVHVYVGVPMSV